MESILEIKINPISVNKCWKGRRFKTSEYARWRKNFLLLCRFDQSGYYSDNVSIEFFISSYNSSDLDNMVKPTLDALVDKGIIKDDRQIQHLSMSKYKVKEKKEEKIVVYIH